MPPNSLKLNSQSESSLLSVDAEADVEALCRWLTHFGSADVAVCIIAMHGYISAGVQVEGVKRSV